MLQFLTATSDSNSNSHQQGAVGRAVLCHGAMWPQYRDLPADAQLCLAVWAVSDGQRGGSQPAPLSSSPPAVAGAGAAAAAAAAAGAGAGAGGACGPWLLGGTTLPLFSKAGRLKTGTRKLKVRSFSHR